MKTKIILILMTFNFINYNSILYSKDPNVKSFITGDNVSLREGPSLNSKVITRIKLNTAVDVFYRSIKGKVIKPTTQLFYWYFIEVDGKKGWMYGYYINAVRKHEYSPLRERFTDKEYDTYIPKFKEYIVNEKFTYLKDEVDENDQLITSEFFEDYFIIDKNYNVKYFPNPDSKLLKKYHKTGISGKFIIEYEKPLMPKCHIKLTNGVILKLQLDFDETNDQIDFFDYSDREEAKEFYKQ